MLFSTILPRMYVTLDQARRRLVQFNDLAARRCCRGLKRRCAHCGDAWPAPVRLGGGRQFQDGRCRVSMAHRGRSTNLPRRIMLRRDRA